MLSADNITVGKQLNSTVNDRNPDFLRCWSDMTQSISEHEIIGVRRMHKNMRGTYA
jgi:hypothetical protein